MFDPAPIELNGFSVTSSVRSRLGGQNLEKIEKPLASDCKKDFNNHRLRKYFSDNKNHNLMMGISHLSCISLGVN